MRMTTIPKIRERLEVDQLSRDNIALDREQQKERPPDGVFRPDVVFSEMLCTAGHRREWTTTAALSRYRTMMHVQWRKDGGGERRERTRLRIPFA